MLKRIGADAVRLGMYIHKFEGSWLRHPFWWPRFVVQTDKALARIRDAGVGVVIDTAKGDDVPEETAARPVAAPAIPSKAPVELRRSPVAPPPPPVLPTQAPKRVIAPAAFGRSDKVRAEALVTRSTTAVKALFEDCQLNRALPMTQVISVVDDITLTIEQNSSAFRSVTRLKTKDNDAYVHSVAVCALMIGLGRTAGASAGEIQALGTAGLLHDIGKVALDETVLQNGTAVSFMAEVEARRHPELGHELLADEKGIPPVVLDVCLNHHERLDGSGYPAGLPFKSISQAARMAMICDCYETMTSSGASGKAMLSVDAINAMRGDEAFDDHLLFKFMRSVGIYPAHMLVRLRSNRLAVVLPSAGEDRRTVVRAFYSTISGCLIGYEDAVLSDNLSDDQAISEEDSSLWFPQGWPAMSERILAGKPITAAILRGEDQRETAMAAR